MRAWKLDRMFFNRFASQVARVLQRQEGVSCATSPMSFVEVVFKGKSCWSTVQQVMIFHTGGDHLRNHQTATQSRLHKVGFQTRRKVSMNSRACFTKATSLRPWKVLQSLSLIPSSVHVFSVSRYTLSSLLDISSTPRYYTNWTRLLLTCVIPLVALVVFNTKIFLGIRCLPLFYHFGCAAFVLFFRDILPWTEPLFLMIFRSPDDWYWYNWFSKSGGFDLLIISS